MSPTVVFLWCGGSFASQLTSTKCSSIIFFNNPSPRILHKFPQIEVNLTQGGTMSNIYERIRKIIENARGNVARAINSEIVVAYWHIGREIIEEEQKGRSRAGYGKRLLEGLANRLSKEFGKGFDDSNLWNMR